MSRRQRLPIFLWIFPELIQDNRWQGTYFSQLPLELIVKIFQYKWLFERTQTKKQLHDYFSKLSYNLLRKAKVMKLRTCYTFTFRWRSPNNVDINYQAKWGPGYISKDVKFCKTIRAKSEHVEYEETNSPFQYHGNRSILPSVENTFGLPISLPTTCRYDLSQF